MSRGAPWLAWAQEPPVARLLDDDPVGSLDRPDVRVRRDGFINARLAREGAGWPDADGLVALDAAVAHTAAGVSFHRHGLRGLRAPWADRARRWS